LNDPQQINAMSEAILTTLPAVPSRRQIISYNPANVPVAHLNISSDTLSVLQLFDCAFNFLRLQLLRGNPAYPHPEKDRRKSTYWSPFVLSPVLLG
jgi:hypothetical protein